MLTGVFKATKKDGTVYYRSSFTYRNKHISLGSFPTEWDAHTAYQEASNIMNSQCSIEDYAPVFAISFEKYVILINLRESGMYFKTPIYLKQTYFYYYFAPGDYLIFDSDDLFYYSSHKIMRRKGHLFVADYGMQVNILSRYGIRNHSVAGKDYIFKNGDICDYRYENIQVINPYYGVSLLLEEGRELYKTRIHINGDFSVGIYDSEIEAAIAYNKAVDILQKKGSTKNYTTNYIEGLSPRKYAEIYSAIKLPKSILEYEI